MIVSVRADALMSTSCFENRIRVSEIRDIELSAVLWSRVQYSTAGVLLAFPGCRRSESSNHVKGRLMQYVCSDYDISEI